MILQEFKRCWKSKMNVIMMIAMFLALLLPYFDVRRSRNRIVHNIETALAQGLDPVDSIWSYERSRGFLMFWEQLFTTYQPFIFLILILFTIGAGVYVGSKLFSTLETGYGTFVMTRISYKNYLKQNLLAQFLYVLSFFLLFFSLVFISLLIVEGGPIHVAEASSIGRHGAMALWLYLLIHFSFILHISISMGLLILLASVSCVFLKNKYLVSLLPLGTFIGFFMLASFFWDTNQLTYFLAKLLTYEHSLGMLIDSFSVTTSSGSWFFAFAHPLLLLGTLMLY